MIFPFSEHWIPWYQRVLFRFLEIFGSRFFPVRYFLGGRWEYRFLGDPFNSNIWLPYLVDGEPRWGCVRGQAIKVEEW